MENLIGKKFGKLTIIQKAEKRKDGKKRWLCQCECGTIKDILEEYLIHGKTKSCGNRTCKVRKNRIDLVGKKFGRLTVLKRLELGPTIVKWECQCECGTIKQIAHTSLIHGKTKSCGCYRRDMFLKKDKLHEVSGSLEIIDFIPGDSKNKKKPKYLCKCTCGEHNCKTIVEVDKYRFDTGDIKSCGAKQYNLLIKIGDKYNNLTIIEKNDQEMPNGTHRPLYTCQCTCGNIIETAWPKTKFSCGCCNRCSSKGEERIYLFLKNNNINNIRQYQYNDLVYKSKLRFDFAVRDQNNKNLFLIEFDGEQHFTSKCDKFFKKDPYEKRKIKDELKNDYCKKKNIPLLRISYKDEINIDIILESYIKENFPFLLN